MRKREWESPSCNFCNSNEKKLYLLNPRKKWYGKPLRLVECINCHLVYADPRPTFASILPTYESEWAEQIRIRKLNRPNVRDIHRGVVEEAIECCDNPKTLFDVGTGAGTLLLEARTLGLEVAGNEINKPACEWLQKQGIRAYNIPTNELELDEKFDIITALDYLEHSYTPFDDLKWASRHLNPRGVFYFKTLYLGCPNHKEQGDDWNLFEQGHFHYFYSTVLRNMLHDTGFKILGQKLTVAIIHIITRKVKPVEGNCHVLG